MKKPKKLPADHAWSIMCALELIRAVLLERPDMSIRAVKMMLKAEMYRYCDLSASTGLSGRFPEITNDHLLRPKK